MTNFTLRRRATNTTLTHNMMARTQSGRYPRDYAMKPARAISRRFVLAGSAGLLASPAIIGRTSAATRGVSDTPIITGTTADLSGVTAVQAMNKLLNRGNIFHAAGNGGTPHNDAVILSMFEKNVPDVFPLTCARSMYEPFNRLKFGQFASYSTAVAEAAGEPAEGFYSMAPGLYRYPDGRNRRCRRSPRNTARRSGST